MVTYPILQFKPGDRIIYHGKPARVMAVLPHGISITDDGGKGVIVLAAEIEMADRSQVEIR